MSVLKEEDLHDVLGKSIISIDGKDACVSQYIVRSEVQCSDLSNGYQVAGIRTASVDMTINLMHEISKLVSSSRTMYGNVDCGDETMASSSE